MSDVGRETSLAIPAHAPAEVANKPLQFQLGQLVAGIDVRPNRYRSQRGKKREAADPGLAFMQTKGAVRLMRAYSEISSRTTKYALVVLAESLRNKERG